MGREHSPWLPVQITGDSDFGRNSKGGAAACHRGPGAADADAGGPAVARCSRDPAGQRGGPRPRVGGRPPLRMPAGRPAAAHCCRGVGPRGGGPTAAPLHGTARRSAAAVRGPPTRTPADPLLRVAAAMRDGAAVHSRGSGVGCVTDHGRRQ